MEKFYIHCVKFSYIKNESHLISRWILKKKLITVG